MSIRSLKALNVTDKVVLCRVDLNVPMKHGKVEDATRIERLKPTLNYLVEQNAKVVVLSHFGRPKGQFNLEMSLAPLADALAEALGGLDVKFAVDCIGHEAQDAVDALQAGEVLLLENVRFYAGETKNDPEFIDALASLGDIYVNDTFSCSHRAHASVVGLAEKLPSAAGLLLQEEIENLETILTAPQTPMAAIVGGSKVSTKLELLQHLISATKMIVIGGAMANTFLAAKGYAIGTSLYEKELMVTAQELLTQAEQHHCHIALPSDVVVAQSLERKAECKVVTVDKVPDDQMILDIGPQTIADIAEQLRTCKTLVWNGPLGAFEIPPFDVGTISLARSVAMLTQQNTLVSVAGGGDVVAALGCAGLTESFTYISTAGGAFLEWLEGKGLPGIDALSG